MKEIIKKLKKRKRFLKGKVNEKKRDTLTTIIEALEA